MDVWKIGVAISMTNGVSPVLAVIARDLLGIKASVGEVEKGFNKWSVAIGGAVAVLAGGALIDGIAKLIQHGTDLVHVQQQMASGTGVSAADVAQATAASWKEAAAYGLKVADVLSDIKEARQVFGSDAEAIKFIDPLEKMRVVLNAVSSGRGDQAHDAVYEMARAGELKGLFGSGQFAPYFDEMTKAIEASGGKVTPKDFMQFTKYAGVAGQGYSEDFYTKYAPSMIQELGASRAGNAMMSLFQAGVRQTKGAATLWRQLGLLDPTKVRSNGTGVSLLPGAFVDDSLRTSNPEQWLQQIVRPAIEKYLGHTVSTGDPATIDLLGNLLQNRTAAQAASTLMLQNQRLNKDYGLDVQAPGLSAASGLLQHDPTTAMNNFTASWDNLLTALGAPMVQDGVSALNAVASAFKGMNAVVVAHPGAAKLVGEALIGLGLVLAALGTAAVIAAAAALIPGGAIAVAVATIGMIITSIVAFNWTGLVDKLQMFSDATENFFNKILGINPGHPTVGAPGSPTAPGTNPFGPGGLTSPYFSHQGRDNDPLVPPAGLFHPSSYVPSIGGAYAQPVAVFLDGRKVGEMVGRAQARSASWSNNSSVFDGSSMAPVPDQTFA